MPVGVMCDNRAVCQEGVLRPSALSDASVRVRALGLVGNVDVSRSLGCTVVSLSQGPCGRCRAACDDITEGPCRLWQ